MARKFYIIFVHEGLLHTEQGFPLHYDEATGDTQHCKCPYTCEQLKIGKKHYIIREVAERIADRQNKSPGNKNYSFVVPANQLFYKKKSTR